MNLKQLSDHLGLSPTTVSRALNGYGDVAEETRRRVEEGAAIYGYIPDRRARGLAMGRSDSVACLINTAAPSESSKLTWETAVMTAAQALAQNGYRMFIIPYSSKSSIHQLKASVEQSGAAILVQPQQDDPAVQATAALNIKTCSFGGTHRSSTISRIALNSKASIEALAARIVADSLP